MNADLVRFAFMLWLKDFFWDGLFFFFSRGYIWVWFIMEQLNLGFLGYGWILYSVLE